MEPLEMYVNKCFDGKRPAFLLSLPLSFLLSSFDLDQTMFVPFRLKDSINEQTRISQPLVLLSEALVFLTP